MIAELGSIPTFVALEVFSHQGPLTQLSKSCDIYLQLGLPVWECKMMGFRALTTIQLQLHTPEQRGSIELAFYMWFGMPKEPPQVFHANPVFILYDNIFE